MMSEQQFRSDEAQSVDDAMAGDRSQVGRDMADRLMERGAFLPALMTVEYVAKLLNVVPRVVRRMIALGKIPAMKLGKAWLIPRDAFVRMVEQRAMRQLPAIALEDEV